MQKMLTMFSLITLFFTVFFAVPVLAQTDMLGTEYAASSGLGNADPRLVVFSIINVILGLLGIICLIIFLYSGFEWMTAMGNDQKVNDAKRRIWYTVIGLAIILSAYSIARMVFKILYESTTGRFFN